jgi:hypothetical protein
MMMMMMMIMMMMMMMMMIINGGFPDGLEQYICSSAELPWKLPSPSNHSLHSERFTALELRIISSVAVTSKWSSYDRTWFSGPDKQEIFILILLHQRTDRKTEGGSRGSGYAYHCSLACS